MNIKFCYAAILVTVLYGCSEGGTGGTGGVIAPPVDSSTGGQSGGSGGTPGTSNGSTLVPVGSMQSFEEFIKLGLSQWAGTTNTALATSLSSSPPADSAVGSPASPPAPGAAQESGTTSDINVQVEGVDEADLVRFDGDFLYIAADNEINIVSTNNDDASSSLMNTLSMENNTSINGMYLAKADQQTSLLVILGSEFDYHWQPDSESPWAWRDGTTVLELYDVDDPADATMVNRMQIQGYLIDSRRIDDLLYIVTRATPSIPGLISSPQSDADRAANQELIDSTSLDELLPSIIQNDGQVQALVDPTNCLIPEVEDAETHYPSLVTISAINLRDPADFKSVCMAENAYAIYVSRESMYLISNDYSDNTGDGVIELVAAPGRIKIHKFAFTEAGPAYRGTGNVEGQLITGDPAFRMGEHQGRLAVVTSATFSSGHKLTLLEEGEDFTLVNVGELPNSEKPDAIGKEGEAIYATRIIGNRAYIVTFLTTDPVYVIDLEDLAILGELEIPGFSSYLHPVTENLILGVGKSAAIEDGQAFFQGLKLQLFDVSDPENPVSASEVSIGLRGTNSALSYDAHALAYIRDFEQGTDRFALPISVHGDGVQVEPGTPLSTHYDFSHNGLYLFELDKNAATINPMGAIKSQSEESCSRGRERGFIADQAVHFFLGNQILSSLWNLPDQTSELVLSEESKECFLVDFLVQ